MPGVTTTRNRDFPLQLRRQVFGRRGENLRPSVFHVTCLGSKRGEMNGHDAIVDLPTAATNQTLMLKRTDNFRSSRQLNGKFSGNRRDGSGMVWSRPEKRENLDLQGTDTW